MLAADSADSSIKFWSWPISLSETGQVKPESKSVKVECNKTGFKIKSQDWMQGSRAWLSVCEERIRIGTEDGLT